MFSTTQIPARGFPGAKQFGTEQFDAERFLDQVIAALTVADAAALRQLESAAPKVVAPGIAAPGHRARYLRKRAVFAALLLATARNLRFLRRVTGRNASGLYAPSRN